MLLQKKESVKSKEKKDQVKEDNIDELLKGLNKIDIVEPVDRELQFPVDPELEFPVAPDDKVLEDTQKSKELSILKKVDGAINYFAEKQKDIEKNPVPKYLFDITIDIPCIQRCQYFNNICYTRLPLIVINEAYYKDFKMFLQDYYEYKDYAKNKTLIEYLILGEGDIKNYEVFHDPKNSLYLFAAEVINTALVIKYVMKEMSYINGQLQEYFKENNITGIHIDYYYDNWANKVMSIFFNYILFQYNQSPETIICSKCRKTIIYINCQFNIFTYHQGYYYEKLYENIEDNQTYEKSVDIANNIVNNLDLPYFPLNENDNKDKEKDTDKSLLNIIYYDENINDNRNEIVGDSFVFEKECNGTLLLVTSIESMLILMKEIKKTKENPAFLLISPGSCFERLMKYLQKIEDLNKYISSAVIYTLNAQKYLHLKDKYDIIKGIYTETEDIVNYIRNNKSNKYIKYKVNKLITYKEYTEKYIDFHKIIILQYGKLYQQSSYLTALNLLQDFLNSSSQMDEFDIQILLQNLNVFSRGARDYKKIIKEYTNESFYKQFNKWLYKIDTLAIRKVAFFISGLQLSLNIYGIRDKKDFNIKSELYRGILLKYSDVLNYERNKGNIITFPSFFSTTLDVEIAKDFSDYNASKEQRNGLFSANYIIRLNPNNDWISQGFNISSISSYKNEKEILFQPFCFFRITDVKVDKKIYVCFIYLELIGKKEIWEESMNRKSSVLYQKPENYIELLKLGKLMK